MKKLSALIVAMFLIASLMMTAFAAPNAVGDGSTTNSGDDIAVTVTLNLATGLAVPSVDFEIAFEQYDLATTDTNYATDAALYQLKSEHDAPIAAITVSFTSADRATTDTNTVIMKQVLVDLPAYTAAGVYKYTITETTGTDAGVTYATSEYNMYVTVKNGTSGCEVDNVVIVNDSTTTTPGTGTKIDAGADDEVNGTTVVTDPTDPAYDSDIRGTGMIVDDANGFVFNNSYVEIVGQPDVDDDGDGDGDDAIEDVDGDGDPSVDDIIHDADELAFGLTNNVGNADSTGTDLADKTLQTPYTITVQAPALGDVDGDGAVDYATSLIPSLLVTDKDGKITDVIAATVDTATGEVSYDVTLGDGESAYFATLPVGVDVTVENKSTAPGYDVKYTGMDNGIAIDSTTNGDTDPSDVTVTIGTAGDSSVSYTNVYDNTSASPTGILVNNAPYMVVTGMAMLFCLVILFAKRRDAEEE